MSIIIFCTCYKAYLQSRRNDSKRGRLTTVEELIGAFSLTGTWWLEEEGKSLI